MLPTAKFTMTIINTDTTNKQIINTLSTHRLSMFITKYAEQIYKNYTSGEEGFEKWLEEKADIHFWNKNFGMFSNNLQGDDKKC